MSELVTVEDDGRVRHVVLNRAEKRNALNAELILALRDTLREAADDGDVHCVVLRGEGPSFSAGIDVFELGSLGNETQTLRPFRSRCLEAANLLEEMAKPTIAQIQGACRGLGAELALACDMRVMADDVSFGLPEVRLGLIPDVGGSTRLPAIVGLGNAKELVMTGRTIGGSRVPPHRPRQPAGAGRLAGRRDAVAGRRAAGGGAARRRALEAGAERASRDRRSRRAWSRR